MAIVHFPLHESARFLGPRATLPSPFLARCRPIVVRTNQGCASLGRTTIRLHCFVQQVAGATLTVRGLLVSFKLLLGRARFRDKD